MYHEIKFHFRLHPEAYIRLRLTDADVAVSLMAVRS
jgi:hypothetical protein